MFTTLKADYRRYNRFTLKLFIQTTLLVHGFQATIVYRFGRWSARQTFLIRYLLLAVYFLLERLIRAMYGIHLSSKANIGPGFYIGHFGGVYLGECTLGTGCSVNQRVFIDKNMGGRPLIGSNVWIGAHTRIIGPVQIEDGSATAAGSRVESNVPPRCLVAGNPARVIKTDFDTSLIL